MSKHNYTNPAFCQNSEFYPVPSTQNTPRIDGCNNVDAIYNRSLNVNYNSIAAANSSCGGSVKRNPRDGPLRIQRSMSSRSFASLYQTTATATTRKPQVPPLRIQQMTNLTSYMDNTMPARIHTKRPVNLNQTAESVQTRCNGSGRYALVPLEDLPTHSNNRYAIVPGTALVNNQRLAKSQDNLDCYTNRDRLRSDEEPHSFHEDAAEQFTSLPPVFDSRCAGRGGDGERSDIIAGLNMPKQKQTTPKIKHAFSSDFGSKSFLIVDKNSNQRYQMVPTAEDEELVDDNQEIIQMHNGRAHRYAVIPTEEDDEDEILAPMEEETCLSTSDLNQSQNFMAMSAYVDAVRHNTPLPRTSTPQKGMALSNLAQNCPNTPYKNPVATKMLHELLSTPRKGPLPRNGVQSTPRKVIHGVASMELRKQNQYYKSQQQIYYGPTEIKKELSPQRLHYETIKTPAMMPSNNHGNVAATATTFDRSMAVITPRVANGSRVYPEVEDCSSIHGKSMNNSSYPRKVVHATITLAIVSIMLVIGSIMNTGIIIYLIAHIGKSFYLQFSLVASFSGVGLGYLGFRSRHCDWLPNRSYTSGYVLVTMFCLLKCCGLLVILLLDPYPGLPLHDVTTGVILGLSTFTIFFISLGVVGSLWCYRPPPDNRVNVV